jgi:hypothetical protein
MRIDEGSKDSLNEVGQSSILDRFRITETTTTSNVADRQVNKPTGKRQSHGQYLSGPIPLDWLARAAKINGKALHVGILLWYRKAVTRSYDVTVSGIRLEQFKVSRQAYAKAINQLEGAGLIRVERRVGKKAMVTILTEWEGEDEQNVA